MGMRGRMMRGRRMGEGRLIGKDEGGCGGGWGREEDEGRTMMGGGEERDDDDDDDGVMGDGRYYEFICGSRCVVTDNVV